jgi:hypothetical protein
MKLPKRIRDLISQKLGVAFDKVKAKLLVISGYSKLTLPGIYMEAAKDSGGSPDLETLQSMVDSTKNYIDSAKLTAINRTIKEAEAYLQTTSKPAPEDIEKILRDSWEDVTSKMKQIAETEATAFRNMGLLEGVLRVSASKNIKDPTVVFLTSKDAFVCDECKKVHLMPDGITPKAWKLSEVGHGYHKRGENFPSMWDLHPHGRCSIILVLPNFGFKGGNLAYISEGYDLYDDQHAIE